MIGRNKHVDRGSLFFWGPELSASVPRLLRQDLKPIDLFAVELAVSVTGDSQPIDGKPAAYVCGNLTCDASLIPVEALRERCAT